jgi:hypothetical protein
MVKLWRYKSKHVEQREICDCRAAANRTMTFSREPILRQLYMPSVKLTAETFVVVKKKKKEKKK